MLELPGCFATGDDRDELLEALTEALELHLGYPVGRASWQPGSTNVEEVGILIGA